MISLTCLKGYQRSVSPVCKDIKDQSHLSVVTEDIKESEAGLRQVRGGHSLVLSVDVEMKGAGVVSQHAHTAVTRQAHQLLSDLAVCLKQHMVIGTALCWR